MQKIFYASLFFLAVSCNRGDIRPNFPAAPDPANLARQQAPFGVSVSDVKLKKVLQDQILSVEYIYEGDLLSEERRYDATSYVRVYQKGKFTRVDNLPESFSVLKAYYDAQGDSASTYTPLFTQSFTKPNSDSIRRIEYQQAGHIDKSSYTFAFD